MKAHERPLFWAPVSNPSRGGFRLVELTDEQLGLLEEGGYIPNRFEVKLHKLHESPGSGLLSVDPLDLEPANEEAMEVLASKDSIRRLEAEPPFRPMSDAEIDAIRAECELPPINRKNECQPPPPLGPSPTKT